MVEPARYAMLFDFDGTITEIDTAEYILDKFGEGDWRESDRLLDLGKITLEDCMQRQFAMVHVPPETILSELDKVVKLRPGLTNLMALAMEKKMKAYVTSAGLDFVVRHFLKKVELLDLFTLRMGRTVYAHGHLKIEFGPLRHGQAQSFKDDLVLSMHEQGCKVIYLGDGPPDRKASSLADLRFAARGRNLEQYLIEEGLEHQSFSDFTEVASFLRKLLG